jgi:hypothetical protein
MRIDTSGRLLVGTSSTSDTAFLIVQGNTATSTGPAAINIATGTATPPNGNGLGFIRFSDSGHSEAATIAARRDGGTWSASSKPTRLEFSVTADGSASPTEALRITNDRYVRLASGSGGIQFNGDTAAANALDDYEEGTWTPVLSDGTNNATSNAITQGHYTKIGNVVHIRLYMVTTALGSTTGAIRITGLPFGAASQTYAAVTAGYGVGLAITAGQSVGVYAQAGTSYLSLWTWDSTGGVTAMQATEWSDDGAVMVNISYSVS